MNESNFYVFKDREGLVEKLNKLLPTKLINVTHCKTNGTGETGCFLKISGLCYKLKYPIIVDVPDPPQHANATGCKNETILCNSAECLCNKVPWINVSCCDGLEKKWRNVSLMPNCKSLEEVNTSKCANPCTQKTTFDDARAETSNGREPEKPEPLNFSSLYFLVRTTNPQLLLTVLHVIFVFYWFFN